MVINVFVPSLFKTINILRDGNEVDFVCPVSDVPEESDVTADCNLLGSVTSPANPSVAGMSEDRA